MTTVSIVEAEARQGSGKGCARAVRRAGMVPGVVYGGDKTPELCTVPAKELTLELHQPGFFTKVFNLKLDGKTQQVMAKDIQFHPVTDRPLHVDFMRVSKDTRVTVAIPVHFINEDKSPGLKRGGVLTIVVRNLEVSAPVNAIPEEFVVDLSGLDIHGSVHIDTLAFAKGVTATHPDRDYTLATISAPTTETEKSADASDAGSTPAAS